MEVVASDQRLRELFDQGCGFIFNDFEGHHNTHSSMDFNKLHRASCDECDPRRDHHPMSVRTAGQKIWFPSMTQAVIWLMENRPGNYSKCTRCNP